MNALFRAAVGFYADDWQSIELRNGGNINHPCLYWLDLYFYLHCQDSVFVYPLTVKNYLAWSKAEVSAIEANQ